MMKQVQALVLVQELDALLDDLEAGNGRQQEEALGVRVEDPTATRSERERLAAGIDADLLRRYARLRARYARAVVATCGRLCLGCNTLRPTAAASRAEGLETCERCGRILLRVELPSPAASPPSPGGAEGAEGAEGANASAPAGRGSSRRAATRRTRR